MYSFQVKTVFPSGTMASLKKEFRDGKKQQRMLEKVTHEAERAYRVRTIKGVVNKYSKTSEHIEPPAPPSPSSDKS